MRVHADAPAAESARALNARAYTVGRDIVFAPGTYQPETAAGRWLLAHELTHVAQQAQSAPGAWLQRACLPASQCATPKGVPRAGSAKEYGAAAEAATAPKREAKRQQTPAQAQAGGHGRRAVEIEKLFVKHLPSSRSLIHGVFVDDTLPPDADAMHADCLKWANATLPPNSVKTDFTGATHACVFVPKKLEDNAAAYNQLKKTTPDLEEFLRWAILRPLTHEVTHERFREARITYPADKSCSAASLAKELGELAAVISEFPIVSRLSVKFREPWSKDRLKDPRTETTPTESISGSIRDIRCSCACEDADALIRQAFEVASSTWSKEQKREFHLFMTRGEGKPFGVHWPYDPTRLGRVGRHELSLAGGLGLSGSDRLGVAFLTYRLVVWNLAQGRLRLTAGAQLNVASFLESDPSGELGAAIVGLQYLSTPVSRDKIFGGLTGRVETGLGRGEFSLRPAEPGTAGSTGDRHDWILQVSGGVQFFLPGLTKLRPVSLEAGFRWTQPLDPTAQRIQTAILSASFSL